MLDVKKITHNKMVHEKLFTHEETPTCMADN